ncbi:MAG: hypothetical protein OEW05_00045 [Candidatus Aminicenantes bacterium]|nr:hypothetical protein [Candidatus Aminicenantes bacterium]
MDDDSILHSWKEISRHLQCDRKTCTRWEEEFGLPIRRVDTASKRARVFAYKSELDRWVASRAAQAAKDGAARARRWKAFAPVAAALVLVAAAALFIFRPGPSAPPTIVVFPIRNQSEALVDRYFCLGLTKEIIRRLSLLGRAVVVEVPASRGLSAPAEGSLSVPGLEQADYVVTGDARRDEEQIYLSFLFNQARRNRTLWQKTYREKLDNLPDCLDDVLINIQERVPALEDLRVTATAGLPAGGQVLDPYLKGNYLLSWIQEGQKDPWALYHRGSFYSQLGEREANELAKIFFTQALETNPQFAPAYLGLAQCYTNDVNFHWRFEVAQLDKADELVLKAQALAPDLPDYFRLRIESLLIREVAFGGDYGPDCFALAKDGLARYPYHGPLNSIVGYCYFRRFDRLGSESDLGEARRFKEYAFWSDPFALANLVYAEILMLKREFDKAFNVCAGAFKINPSSLLEFRMAEIHYYRGELKESEAIFRRLQAPADGKFGELYYLGMIAARGGDAEGARRILGTIELLDPLKEAPFFDNLRLASIYAGLGEMEKARGLLRAVFSAEVNSPPSQVARRYFEIDRNFDGLRTEFLAAR